MKMNIFCYLRTLRLLTILVISISNLHAEDISDEQIHKWEFGLGLGFLSLPHYRGSDEKAEVFAPIPYLRYSGDRLKVDREGGRFYLFNSPKVDIDLSLAFALAVDSKDNKAREGMPDLDSVIEIGPRLQFNLYESKDKDLRFRFAFPFRAAFSVDLDKVEHIGWFFAPYAQVRYYFTGWESAVSVGPTWGSEQFHNNFYEVKPQYSTATRPAYEAQSGYSGSRVSFNLSKRYEKVFVGLFMKYDDLRGATFLDSPLVKKDNSFVFGAVLSWVFYASKTYRTKEYDNEY